MTERATLCVCGLAAEARIARAAGFQAVVGGGDATRAAALVGQAMQQAACLVSFGIAGGLAPQLQPGDVILTTEIVGDGRRWRPDADFCDLITDLAARLGAVGGPVLGTSGIIATPEDKRRFWRDTGALAVDLESVVVARAAADAGIPFLAMRAIADPATRALPPAALLPLAANGYPALRRVIAEVLRRPQQIGALVGLACDTRRALAALARPAQALHLALPFALTAA